MARLNSEAHAGPNAYRAIRLTEALPSPILDALLPPSVPDPPPSESDCDGESRAITPLCNPAPAKGLKTRLCDNSTDEQSESRQQEGQERSGHEENRTQQETGLRATRPLSHAERMVQLGKKCTDAEQALLDRVVDLTNVPENYCDVCVDEKVTKALERATVLGITRRDQFEVGILRASRIGGVMLYGPPGTGKTVLAQAVAKQCGFSMLAITSGDIFQKAWGDDEKVIRAAFSLSRRLHPCIMFIDEADAIFGARQTDDKKHIRGMISEFLCEWDGASGPKGKQNPLVLLATNRPFDVDQAILRRAPVRICLDIPTPQLRERILEVMLRDETLEGITVQEITKLTRLYTGSDLRGLCVSAAIHCIEEQRPDADGKYPERKLQRCHFKAALKEIRATPPNRLLAKQLLDFQKRLG